MFDYIWQSAHTYKKLVKIILAYPRCKLLGFKYNGKSADIMFLTRTKKLISATKV